MIEVGKRNNKIYEKKKDFSNEARAIQHFILH